VPGSRRRHVASRQRSGTGDETSEVDHQEDHVEWHPVGWRCVSCRSCSWRCRRTRVGLQKTGFRLVEVVRRLGQKRNTCWPTVLCRFLTGVPCFGRMLTIHFCIDRSKSHRCIHNGKGYGPLLWTILSLEFVDHSVFVSVGKSRRFIP